MIHVPHFFQWQEKIAGKFTNTFKSFYLAIQK